VRAAVKSTGIRVARQIWIRSEISHYFDIKINWGDDDDAYSETHIA
jgi:hypothetical protein